MYTQENDRVLDVGQPMKSYQIQPSKERKEKKRKEKKTREEANVLRKQLPLLMSCRYVHERA
jgi:hypothetical protein